MSLLPNDNTNNEPLPAVNSEVSRTVPVGDEFFLKHSASANKISKITLKLAELGSQGGFDLQELIKVWTNIPIGDSDGIDYLEVASQCILDVSSLVDKTYPNLTYQQRVAVKFRLMGRLLDLKADELV